VAVALALVRNLRAQRAQTAAHVAELEAFAGRTAHDLRGPLSPVRGYADLLQLDEREGVRSYGQKIRKATDRMDGIIDDLLALSVSGKPRPGASPVGPAIDAVLAELAITDADVSVEVDHSIAAVSSGVLAQLLRNVIGNASKYRSPARRLVLRVACAKGAVSVADNGIGMDADATRHAFDPYFRADTALPGHGLGLAIVRRTVEACGGSCELASTPGEGTTVTLRLPLQQAG
jgi:two-component system, OmpR family, sensor kinase